MYDISFVRYLPKNTTIPFISWRKISMVLSILAIIGSIFLFSTRNLNYGIDFKGGTVVEFQLDHDPSDADMETSRRLGESIGLGAFQVQTITIRDEATGVDNIAIRLSITKQPALEGDETDDRAQQIALDKTEAALKETFGDSVKFHGRQVLGSKVSDELKTKGALAVILALFFVLLYIWVRFEWQFGAGAVIALAHDVILTIGVFSLTQLEFNLSIVAAILTIVGYSLNDTVIVYDRIRENLRKFKSKPLEDVLNLSINDTLSRTIMTSVTTMLALVALFVWGGDGLHGFAFAMIWGVFVGTYSSIFVAAPVLMVLGVNRTGAHK
ncbi:MAG: protein translocase subunit SecF [Robiginitomaculum sp.]|nr:MAG: protein translocase subunit SecF [Robiginitomaculum sp.]